MVTSVPMSPHHFTMSHHLFFTIATKFENEWFVITFIYLRHFEKRHRVIRHASEPRRQTLVSPIIIIINVTNLLFVASRVSSISSQKSNFFYEYAVFIIIIFWFSLGHKTILCFLGGGGMGGSDANATGEKKLKFSNFYIFFFCGSFYWARLYIFDKFNECD